MIQSQPKGVKTMNRLKELRKEKGDTQDQVAKVAGVSKRSYIYWENSERQIKPDKAQALADHFGVSVGYLLGYSDKTNSELTEWEVADKESLIALEDFLDFKISANFLNQLKEPFEIFLKENKLKLSATEKENFLKILVNDHLKNKKIEQADFSVTNEPF